MDIWQHPDEVRIAVAQQRLEREVVKPQSLIQARATRVAVVGLPAAPAEEQAETEGRR